MLLIATLPSSKKRRQERRRSATWPLRTRRTTNTEKPR